MQDDGNMGKIPRVYINTEEDNEECFLLVYRALGASICLLMKSKQSTVLPAKSDSDVMFCLQRYQGLIIDRSLVY